MEKWNYKLPIPQPIWNFQKDWNQTLTKQFNVRDKQGKTFITNPDKCIHEISL